MRCLALVLLSLLVTSARAETARQILDRAKALDDGPRWWDDRYEHMKLEVEISGTAPRHLELKAWDRKEHGRKQQSLAIFVTPASIAGVALLGHTFGGVPARQWLYTPVNKRVREIGKSSKRLKFGDVTDLTYHDLDVLTDLLNWTEEETKSTLRGIEAVDGVPCYAIELEPRLEHVIYPRVVLWLGKDDLVARQVEFYEAAKAKGWLAWLFGGGSSDDGQPVRRYRQRDVRLVGAVPVAHRIEVETPAEKSRTTIHVEEVLFNQHLPEAFFDQGSLPMRVQ